MSNITSLIQFFHQDSATTFQVSSLRAATDSGFSVESIEVSTSDETVDTSEFNDPRQILLRLMSGSDLLVGLDGATYPFRLSGANDFMVLRLDLEGIRETQTVVTVADVAASLDGTYFVVTDKNAETWAIGFGITSGSHGEDYTLSVTISTGASAATVAAALYAALVADTAFSALFDASYDAATDDDFVTITDKFTGTRDNIADTGSTGFTLATTQAGAATQAVHLKSAGTSQVLVGVVPD